MTILEAVNAIDTLKSNAYTWSEKIAWLSRLDGMAKSEIFDTHEGEVEFSGYDENTDRSTELLIPAPYDEVYLRWLEAQIDYANGEYAKYNNSASMYNTAYSAFRNYWNRTHKPVGKQWIYF